MRDIATGLHEHMTPFALFCVIFLLVLGGILIGTALRRVLPDHHLSKETRDVVRLGAGLVATIAALVLGLLIGGAKGSFDIRSTQVKQLTANIILLDNLLAQYGPEAAPLRREARAAINPLVERLRYERRAPESSSASSEGEEVYLWISKIATRPALRRSSPGRALEIAAPA